MQMVLAHQTRNPPAGHSHAVTNAQTCPVFAVSFAGKWRGGQVVTDQGQQISFTNQWMRASAPRRRPRILPGCMIERGASLLPDVADALDTIGLVSARGDRLAHFGDLRLAKGPGFFTRSQSSSFSMVNSPMRRMAWLSSA